MSNCGQIVAGGRLAERESPATSQDPPRYAIADLPPGRVKVRVQWEGRVFVAARIEIKGRWCWCVAVAGGGLAERGSPATGKSPATGMTILPPHGEGWTPAPDWWQPLDPATWGMALPRPLPDLIRPVLVSKRRGRFYDARAEQAAEAERIAAEIEDELGERAPSGSGDAPAGSRPPGVEPLYYNPRGSISRAEARARVCRAIQVDGVKPWGAPQGFAAASAGLANMVAETLTSDDADRPRFEPSPRDLDDYLTAFAWFVALNPPQLRPNGAPLDFMTDDQKALGWVAWGYSLKRTGQALGVGKSRAQQRIDRAVDRVHRAANGLPVFEHVTVRDEMALVRAENRAFRRREP